MAHMTPFESNELIKRLRQGEKVKCPFCQKGEFVTRGEYKTTPGFHCNSCNVRINIDLMPTVSK